MKAQKKGNETKIEEIILKNTGYDNVEDFLNGQPKYDIKYLKEVADEIKRNIINGTPITIVGDYDVDGITASSIMLMALQSLGANVKVRLPYRISEGFGLSEKIVNEIDEGLIITVDNGIAAIDAVKKAKEKGLEVIVTDHHLPNADGILPDADYLIDAHLPNTADYADYCGAGIAYKLAEQLIDDKNLLNKLSCFAALGTVSDVMPLNEDNRNIVKLGLENMVTPSNRTLGLELMLARNYCDEFMTTVDIGFKMGPLINAAGRLLDTGAIKPLQVLTQDLTNEEKNTLKDIEKKIDYKSPYNISFMNNIINLRKKYDLTRIRSFSGFKSLSEEDWKAFKRIAKRIYSIQDQVEELIELNNKRKQLVDECIARFEKQIAENEMQNDFPLVLYEPNFLTGEETIEGIMGIIAGKLAEKYNTPCFAFTDAEEPGILKGSARTARMVHLKELLDKTPDEFYKYGGHAEAAGISVEKAKLDSIRQTLMSNCVEPLGYVKDDTIYYDLEIDVTDLPKVLEELDKFEPYGEANPKIVFKIKNFEITPTEEIPSGLKYSGADSKYVKILGNKVAAFGDTEKYLECIADQLLFEISKFSNNEKFTPEQKTLMGYAISYFTRFQLPNKNKLNDIFDLLEPSNGFKRMSSVIFDLIAEDKSYATLDIENETLLDEAKEFCHKDAFSDEEINIVRKMLDYYTNFKKENEEQLDKIAKFLKTTSPEFDFLCKDEFDSYCQKKQFQTMYSFKNALSGIKAAKKIDVIGTVSVNYFRGEKNIQLDILGLQDPERILEKNKEIRNIPENEKIK